MRVVRHAAFALFVLLSIVFVGSSGRAIASDSEYPDHCSPTGFPGLESCPTPPLDVAKRANPEELRSWGVPVPPDKKLASKAYDVWFTAHFLMRHVVQPYGAYRVGRPKPLFHDARLRERNVTPDGGNLLADSPRASGYAIEKSATGTSSLILTMVSANVVMPADEMVLPCSGQYTQSEGAFWAGIDGFGGAMFKSSFDVLQGGIIDDVICDGNSIYEALTPFIEFYPNPPICVPFQNVDVNIGDSMLFQAAQDANSPTEGYALIADMTQNVSAAYLLQAKTGYPYNGFSAEVIVERACSDAGGTNCNALPDFGDLLFTNANAIDVNGKSHPLGLSFGGSSSAPEFSAVQYNAVVSGQTYAIGTISSPTSVGSDFENSGIPNQLTNTCNFP
jgi:hypothetical protein